MITIDPEKVRPFIVPAIFEHFLVSGAQNYEDAVIDFAKWDYASEQVTKMLCGYIPCFDGTALLPHWAAFFNWTFIHFANQQSNTNYNEIETKYKDVITELQELAKSGYCKDKMNKKDISKFFASTIKSKKDTKFF